MNGSAIRRNTARAQRMTICARAFIVYGNFAIISPQDQETEEIRMSLIPEKKYNLFQNAVYLTKESWGFDRRIVLYAVITMAAQIVLPVFDIWLPKVAVDLLAGKADGMQIAGVLGSIALCMIVLMAINTYFLEKRNGCVNMMRKYFIQKIWFKTLDCTYSLVESSEFMKKREAARVVQNMNQSAVQMYDRVPLLIENVVCFILYSTVLSTLHVGIVIYLLCTSGIVYWFAKQETVCRERTNVAFTEAGRKLSYMIGQCGDVKSGKDIRVYSMSTWLGGLMSELMGKKFEIRRKQSSQGHKTQIAGAVLDLLRDGLAYSFLIIKVLQGEISMGDFMLYFGAITGFGNWIVQIIYHMKNLNINNVDVNALRTYLEIPDEDIDQGECELSGSEHGVEIRFEHVSFHYPESDEYIIKDLSFHIKKGEKVALVGLNGAGKTTLVKLMTGLYEPTGGAIFLNGTDITKVPKRQLFSMYAAVFQDIMVLPAKLGENIALKDMAEVDRKRAEEALALAGLKKEFDEKNIGLDRYMTKRITKKGVDLSGGQRQKLMLARALYKDAPVLVLDEPTAALDPIAEKEMYEKYCELCSGKTALFISHRLASTQFSDRIFFMKDGRIAEEGSHKELLCAGGEYAHLYEVQSYYYNLKEEERGDFHEYQEC